MRLRQFLPFVLFALIATACRHKASLGLTADVRLYQQGVEAFRQSTPEGYRRAIEAFQRAANLNPSHCEYRLHWAESLLFLAQEQQINWEESSPRVVEAMGITNSALRAPECSSSGSFLRRLRALGLLQTAANRDAFEIINEAVALDGRDAMNWYVLAQIDSTNSEKALLRAVESDPNYALLQHALGEYRLKHEENEQARQAFSRAIELSPRHFRSLAGLGQVEELEFKPDALSLYRRGEDIAPAFLNLRLLTGGNYVRAGDEAKGIEEYRTAVSLNPRFYPALLELGRTLSGLGRLEEAVEALRKLLDLNPGDARLASDVFALSDAHYLLGQIAVAQDDQAQAKTEFLESLRVTNNVDAMSALGAAYYREGDLDKALSQYENILRVERILKIPREFPDAYLYRGAIRASRRQFVEAVEDYSHAIQIYQRRIAELTGEAEKSDRMNLKRKAELERRQKAALETQLQTARAYRASAETAR
jgi:tetratricopeptide (TPR) repeat protein